MCVVSGRITAAAPCPWRLGYLCIGPIRGLRTIPRAALGELGISAIRLGLSTWQFPELAKAIVDTWLGARFDGGRSVPKVNRIKEYEDDHLLPRNNKTA